MRSHVVDWLAQFVPYDVASLLAPNWFTMVGLAGVVALIWMLRIGKRNHIDRATIAALVLWPYLAAVVGGIAIPLAIDSVQSLVTSGRLTLHWAGMTSFWGYLCGVGALVYTCKKHGLSVARFGDLAAPVIGIALMLSRLGCFLAGCDYGKVTSVPWAMRFPQGSPAWADHVASGLIPSDRLASLPVHPTELYEALLGVIIMIVALVMRRRVHPRGRIVLTSIALYSIGRIGIESLRGDAGRGIYAGLSSGQIFSLVVLAALAIHFVARQRKKLLAQASAGIAAAAALAIVLDVHAAHAQPAPPAPAPATPAATTPPVAPPPVAPPPVAPTPTTAAPVAANSTTATNPPPPAVEDPNRPHLAVAALMGVATVVNRRPDQVGMLAGPTISVGLKFGKLGAFLDFDSFGNRDASHGTVLLSGWIASEVKPGLVLGARVGMGATLVNFDDPAFRDVTGTTFRIETTAEYNFGTSWSLWVRPTSFDILTARDLGGPIASYQFRAGFAYRFGMKARTPPPPPSPVVAPPPPPYPYPYPPPPQPPVQQPPQPLPGMERGVCRADHACDTGLTCASNRCVRLPGATK